MVIIESKVPMKQGRRDRGFSLWLALKLCRDYRAISEAIEQCGAVGKFKVWETAVIYWNTPWIHRWEHLHVNLTAHVREC